MLESKAARVSLIPIRLEPLRSRALVMSEGRPAFIRHCRHGTSKLLSHLRVFLVDPQEKRGSFVLCNRLLHPLLYELWVEVTFLTVFIPVAKLPHPRASGMTAFRLHIANNTFDQSVSMRSLQGEPFPTLRTSVFPLHPGFNTRLAEAMSAVES